MTEKLIDVKELAETLAVGCGWVYRSAEEGRIPSLKVGKYLRFRLSDVLDALGDSGGSNV